MLLRKTELLKKRNALQHRINTWFTIQDFYMPEAQQLHKSSYASQAIPYAEDENLYLPLQLLSEFCSAPRMTSLINKEYCLRVGQADVVLHKVHCLLQILATILEFKCSQHLASERITTRSRQLVLNFRAKTSAASDRYITAYNALQILDPGGEWTVSFKPLNTTVDLQLPRREEDDLEPENMKELSWIWLVPRSEDAQRCTATADEVSDCE